jgi:hypothetical protein
VSCITYYVLRITFYVLRFKLDTLIGLLLFLAGFYAYTYTLAPTVLEGDAALFQYTPYVLGVTYPTGYPLYILLGKLWLTIFPVGEIAWRMNLFSALCSAAALPLIYGAARRLFTPAPTPPETEKASRAYDTLPMMKIQGAKAHFDAPLGHLRPHSLGEARWVALAGVLIFATIPTFWRWSTEAKIYALNILLFSGALYTLMRALETKANPTPAQPATPLYPQTLSERLQQTPLIWPALLIGLQLGVHSTTVLLLPGLLLFAWLNLRPYLFTRKRFWGHSLLLVGPGLLYFYIPLRAEWLINRYGRFEAIGRGLLADFYHSGLAGFVRYFTAADFTGGVATNWGQVPAQFFTVYIPLLLDDLTTIGVGLGLTGSLALAISQPRRFWPLFLLYALPIPFVLTYGQGEQSAFLLPSFLVFSLFAAYALVVINRLLATLSASVLDIRYQVSSIKDQGSSVTFYVLRFTFYILRLAPLLLIPTLFLPQIQHNLTWLTRKWTRAIYDEWADALNHPLEPGAGMLAHWGDLTSFWYMQQVEERRPDLRGVYPPDEMTVLDWYARGNDALYISGPLQGWAAGIEERYQLIPWGRLVRIAPRRLDPRQLLPHLAYPTKATFGDKLRLLGFDYPPMAPGGQPYPVTLTWQTLAELPEQTTISLRLTTQDGAILTQLDERLRSGWFPRETLPAGQHVLSYALVPIPLGALPGEYRLQLVAYESASRPWTLPDGTIALDLGSVTIAPAPATAEPDLRKFKSPPAHDFNGEIELAGYTYTVSRVGQGKGFGLMLLWRAITKPADNYTLVAEALDADGHVLRAVERLPVAGRAPTGSWQPGQLIRDQVDLVAPASAPPGETALQVRLSWRRADGASLPLRRWWLLLGNSLTLDWLEVTEKENRLFTPPAIQYQLEANLENKARLLGYQTPLPAVPGAPNQFELKLAECIHAEAEGCQLKLLFYWQGVSEMEIPYDIFFHLVDAGGQIVAQQDGAPGRRGKEPTTGWLPGEVVAHPVELLLPPDLPPGQYSMHLGMYLPPTGPRLRLLDETGKPASDFVAVGVVEVRHK